MNDNKSRNQFKNMTLLSRCGFVIITMFLSVMSSAQTSTEELKNLIECKSDYAHYSAFASDYENQLSQLGWKRIENEDQPFIYMYQRSEPMSFFGHSTHQIGLTGNAILAILRDVNVQALAKTHQLTQHDFFKHASYFRGERILRTEVPQDESIPVHHKLMLSEIPAKDPIFLLGCNYELDREMMEKALAELEK